ncbi:hypothetical protein GWK47_011727 [Chionoecetes opilio]|uniref:Uncharacterized protein n=1 Tax=Chionoecetes opilio TaxID=41210 RepID=A0A8J4Y1S1_CHIOP|nr:hypothetical protein GWK47_011727 [Chionoecetes opilio]
MDNTDVIVTVSGLGRCWTALLDGGYYGRKLNNADIIVTSQCSKEGQQTGTTPAARAATVGGKNKIYLGESKEFQSWGTRPTKVRWAGWHGNAAPSTITTGKHRSRARVAILGGIITQPGVGLPAPCFLWNTTRPGKSPRGFPQESRGLPAELGGGSGGFQQGRRGVAAS